MGIPSFFRWINEKYKHLITDCVEELPKNNEKINFLNKNPNKIEFDNLYLDMNGIIHPCCHPQDETAPKTEEDMIVNIFKYIDRVFNIVRPRKLIYMSSKIFNY